MSGSSSDDEHEPTSGQDGVPDDSNRPAPAAAALGPSAASSSATTDGGTTMNHEELPFLVTHWLANFASAAASAGQAPPPSDVGLPALPLGAGASSTGATAAAEEREEALRRLHRAAGDVASAFATLGIFGSSTTVSMKCMNWHVMCVLGLVCVVAICTCPLTVSSLAKYAIVESQNRVP